MQTLVLHTATAQPCCTHNLPCEHVTAQRERQQRERERQEKEFQEQVCGCCWVWG